MTTETEPRPVTPTLDRVAFPSDLRKMSDRELTAVAHELRAETISAVSDTGGHLVEPWCGGTDRCDPCGF